MNMLISHFQRVTKPEKLIKNKARTVKYQGTTYKISAPRRSNRKGKKYEVDVYNTSTKSKKKVAFGAEGYSDYTLHKDKARRERFKKRHGAIKLKDGSLAHKNPNQAAYYAYNYNW